MNGTVLNAAAVTAKLRQGFAFSGCTSSHLQTHGFYQLGIGSRSFEYSTWVYPHSVADATLIQKSPYSSTTGLCYSMMEFNGLDQFSMVFYTFDVPSIVGPILPTHSWTHLGYIYRMTNGVHMYINVVLYAIIGSYTMYTSNTIDYLTVGSYEAGYCAMESDRLAVIFYNIVIDEFRRELTGSDILARANL